MCNNKNMPVCKNCKKRIDRFNKDRCPICGVENPFEGVTSDTVEITTNIDVDNINVDYHPRRRKKLLLFFVLIGITGIPFFYMKKKVMGFVQIFLSLAIALPTAFLLWKFVPAIYPFLDGVIGVGAAYLVNIIWGLIYSNLPNLKDGTGEFVV